MAVAFFILLLFQTAAPTELFERVSHLREQRRFPEAAEQLRTIQSVSPDFYRLNDLAYLEAVLRSEAGDKKGAAALLSGLLERDDFPLRDNLLVRMLDLRRGESLAARMPLYEEFLSRYRDHPSWSETAFGLAEELEKEGRREQAGKYYDLVWKHGTGRWSRRAALGHALLHIEVGEKGEAIADLRKLLIKGEQDDVAYRAALETRKLQSPARSGEVDARRLARVLLNNRQARFAREYLRHLIDDFPKSLSRDLYGYLWGRSFVIEGDYDKAIEAYRDNHRRHPKAAWGIYSLYLVANTALRKLDYKGAAQAYREVIETHPDGKYAARAYYNLADCHVWLGEDQKAVETIQEGLERAPSGRLGFLYYLARHSLEREEYLDALGYLLKLDGISSKRLPDGVTREEVDYWKGLCLEKLDRIEESRQAYRAAVDGSPNYFSYLARFRLPNQTPVAVSEPVVNWRDKLLSARPVFADDASRKEFFAKDPNSRARELIFLGIFDEASREIQRTGKNAFPGGNVDRLFNLSYYADLGELPAESISAAERLRDAAFSKRAPEEFPEPVRSLLFPKHYWDLVKTLGQRHGVQPELLLSVIRQESRFQAHAKSPAAARGLMQFMVSTARQLATEMEIDPPSENDLYRPEVSVQLGSYYLSKLLKEFGGSIEKALAAYNGGPENVDRWAAKLGTTDPSFFVANIGYRETKLYVLTVMGNYYAYLSLANPPLAQPPPDSAGR